MNGAFLLCFVLCIAFAVAIPWAARKDREIHPLHHHGCPDYEEAP